MVNWRQQWNRLRKHDILVINDALFHVKCVCCSFIPMCEIWTIFKFPCCVPEWKRCLDRESNSETLTYKVNALPLSCLGRKPISIFSLRKPVRQIYLVYHKDNSTEWTTANRNTTLQWEKDYSNLFSHNRLSEKMLIDCRPR